MPKSTPRQHSLVRLPFSMLVQTNRGHKKKKVVVVSMAKKGGSQAHSGAWSSLRLPSYHLRAEIYRSQGYSVPLPPLSPPSWLLLTVDCKPGTNHFTVQCPSRAHPRSYDTLSYTPVILIALSLTPCPRQSFLLFHFFFLPETGA